MISFDSLSNKEGGLSTHAVEASAHRFGTSATGLAKRKSSSIPSKFFLGYPSLLTSSGCNPNSGFAARVNYRKAPFSFQVQNIIVGNQHRSKRIYDLDKVSLQNKLWSNPKNVYEKSKNRTDHQVTNNLDIVANHPETINYEKRNQNVGSNRPSKVTSRSEGFIHHPSIAGERK